MKGLHGRGGMRKLEELFTYSMRRRNCVTLLPASNLNKHLSNSGGWFLAGLREILAPCKSLAMPVNVLEGIIVARNSEMWYPIGLEASLAVCEHRPYLQDGI